VCSLSVRKECACTGVRFFAILSMQRSGSGWVETLLNSHPNISSNGEIFSVKDRRSNITAITKTLDKLYNLDWYSSAAKNECTAAVGLKWMLNQVILIFIILVGGGRTCSCGKFHRTFFTLIIYTLNGYPIEIYTILGVVLYCGTNCYFSPF
jgi:hypothetical protein